MPHSRRNNRRTTILRRCQVGHGRGVASGGVHAHVEVQNFHVIEALLIVQHIAFLVFYG